MALPNVVTTPEELANAPVGGLTVFADGARLTLPAVPKDDTDHDALCQWLSVSFNLDLDYPIVGGDMEGRGPKANVALYRAGAEPIRFEPVSVISSPQRLNETLNWWMAPTDGTMHKYNAGHCRDIAKVVRMLCRLTGARTDADEILGIIGTFLQSAEMLEGHTVYGTGQQRYEAARALKRKGSDSPYAGKYLKDSNTGELIIASADLQSAARRHTGSSLPHGWVDKRIKEIDWKRITLEGYEKAGRSGRRSGGHLRVFAYCGHLPHAGKEDE
jgi:hypothetical protein